MIKLLVVRYIGNKSIEGMYVKKSDAAKCLG